MNKRAVVRAVFEGKRPPYVPWNFGFTVEAREKLVAHFGTTDLEPILQNHLIELGNGIGYFKPVKFCRVTSSISPLLGERGRGEGACSADDNPTFPSGQNTKQPAPLWVQDIFGVVWDRSEDKDIGVIRGLVLPEPALSGYEFPDPCNPQVFQGIPEIIQNNQDRFRVFSIGFSLYERAWTMRGMENLMMDFHLHPQFVRDLFRAIADYNIAQTREALKYDVDAIYFGDDWGQQRGLQMGYPLWREFIYPELKRMYGVVREAGKFVLIHSCGDVDELFDDLVGIGLNCFNPFQPEVMDVDRLIPQYRGRLAFFGGLSTQRTLPYGTPEEVRAETRHLIELGREGGYILSPAHSVEGDVPLENILAFIDTAKEQVFGPGL